MAAVAVLAAGILFGSVSLGPNTPACDAGVSCSRPATNTLVTFTRAGRSVSTRTDSQGRYRIKLSAGTWYLHAGIGRHLTPTQIVIRAGQHHLNLTIDTGIR
jgi:hypothetical protein